MTEQTPTEDEMRDFARQLFRDDDREEIATSPARPTDD